MNEAVYGHPEESDTEEGGEDEDINLIINEHHAEAGGSPEGADKLNETSSIGFEHLPQTIGNSMHGHPSDVEYSPSGYYEEPMPPQNDYIHNDEMQL